jgi:hypothetical protein
VASFDKPRAGLARRNIKFYGQNSELSKILGQAFASDILDHRKQISEKTQLATKP